MSSESPQATTTVPEAPAAAPAPQGAPLPLRIPRPLLIGLALLAGGALVLSLMLWHFRCFDSSVNRLHFA